MLTFDEIKKEIDALNAQIIAEMDNNLFILNSAIQELKAQIRKLQNICPHKFEGGACVYCKKEEK